MPDPDDLATRITAKLEKLVKTVDTTSDTVIGRLVKLKEQTAEMTCVLEQLQGQMETLEEKLDRLDAPKRKKPDGPADPLNTTG